MITIPYPFLMKYSLNEIFPLKRLKFSAGAQFIVSKENIQKHPKSIYKKFKELNLTHADWGYIFERVWSLIFGNYPIQFR